MLAFEVERMETLEINWEEFVGEIVIELRYFLTIPLTCWLVWTVVWGRLRRAGPLLQ